VKLFTGREKELANLHKIITENPLKAKLTVISQITAVSGLGGIGKSELSRMYAQKYGHYYDNNVIWINAESYESMRESFISLLSNKLNICAKNVDGREKEIQLVVSEAYEYFSVKKCLFIFDNAEQLRTTQECNDGIDKFLPSLPSDANRPYILITSRNSEWGTHISVVQLDVFEESEAIEFIIRALSFESFDFENDSQPTIVDSERIETLGDVKELVNISERIGTLDDIKRLVNILQRFPLALQLAVSYIIEENKTMNIIGEIFTIGEYIDDFNKKEKKLLDFPFPDDNSDGYSKTVFTTWNITFDIIMRKKYGENAIKILNIISFFAPENIPTKMFDSRDEILCVQMLRRYSLLNLNLSASEINIHRLVQRVIQLKLTKESQIYFLKKAFQLIHSIDATKMPIYFSKHNFVITKDAIKNADSEIKEEMLSFAEKFVQDTFPNLLKKSESGALFELPKTLSDLNNLGNEFESQCNEIMPLLNEFHNCSDDILNQLNGLSYQDIERYQWAFNALENILQRVSQIRPSGMDSLTQNLYEVMANLIYNVGQIHCAQQMYQNIFEYQKEKLGGDNQHTLIMKNKLNEITLMLNRYNKMFDLYEGVYQENILKCPENKRQTLIAYHDLAVSIGKFNHNSSLKILQKVCDILTEPDLD
jgi:hypothetical protein